MDEEIFDAWMLKGKKRSDEGFRKNAQAAWKRDRLRRKPGNREYENFARET